MLPVIYIADTYNNAIREINTSGVINTIAGNGSAGYSGDGGGGSSAQLNNPHNIVVDAAGNVYIADYNNDCVRILNTNGIINTFAGDGLPGDSGDGGAATAAKLVPTGIGIDNAGNIYIADGTYNVIRKVSTTGIITTVAGNDTAGYNGDGIAAIHAELSAPQGVTVDAAGNIYIADFNNSRIRKVNTAGIITTVAGVGYASYFGDGMEATTAGINAPTSVTSDASNNIYIADYYNQRIRKVNIVGPAITSQPAFTQSVICNNSNATIAITAVNDTGSGIVTYEWQVDSGLTYPGTWVTITNAGVYSGATTDSLKISNVTEFYYPEYRCIIDNGYDTSNTVYLSVTMPPSVTVTGPTDSVCPGIASILSVSAYNDDEISKKPPHVGVNPYGTYYSWSNGDTTDTISVNPNVTTTYSVAVTENGCTTDTSITVDVDRNKVNATAFPSSTVCSGTNITLFASGGTGSFKWSGGINNGEGFTPVATSTYTVTGIDIMECTLKDSIKITVNPLPKVTVTIAPKDSVCPGTNVTLSGSGAMTYSWSGGIKNDSAFAPTSSAVYYLTGTDSNGCSSTVSVPVVVYTLPVVSATASPNTVCQGSDVTLSGNGGLTYTWSGGVTNGVPFVPASSGTYTVKGTSAQGCTNTATVDVTVNALPSIVATAFPSATLCQGSSLALLGSGGASYQWSGGVNNGVSFTPSASASYTVTGIDANGCENKDSIMVMVHNKVVPTITSVNTLCGLKNGSATAAASNGIPPYTYLWSTVPASTNASVDSLAPGTYVVTVSDSFNCSSSSAVSIASSTAPILSVATTNSNCGSIGTGSASVSVTGGTAPYKYMWNNGDTLSNDYNLKAATYIITVTDVNGCSTFAPAIVTNSNGPKITTLSIFDVKCSGTATGSINVSVSGGTAPYQYLWSTGATTSSISALYAGPYQLTVMDADSCTSVENFTIKQPAPLSIASSSVKADCGVSDGSASVSVSGGLAPYTYAWNNGSSTNIDASVAAGVYHVTVTDDNGCIDSEYVSVSDKTGASLVLSLSANASCGSGGLISVSASGGALPYTYSWNTGSTATSISNVPAGNYYVNVTDGKGCISSADTTVTEVTPSAISICMVTVDPIAEHNYIIWDKSLSKKIAYYNIYKESTSAGVYYKIASVSYDSLGTYEDLLSDPTVRSWRYEISQVDSCGNESPVSPAHKTMHLTVNQGVGNNINLIWDDYEGLNFLTYYIFRDTIATNFTLIDSIPNNIFTYTDNNPPKTSAPLLYRIGINNPGGCTPAIEAVNYNSSKSNTGNLVFQPASVQNVTSPGGEVSIFPNPSTGVFTISMNMTKGSHAVSMTVVNTLGQEISSETFGDVPAIFTKQLDLSSLAKGVYFLKITSDNSTFYNKVVIQ